MQYEFKDGTERPHVYTFDEGWEINAIRAAFSEWLANKLEKGNTSLVSSWKSCLASYPENQKILSRELEKPGHITDVLEEYSANTEDALSAISDQDGIPAYIKGGLIAERFLTGTGAGKLMSLMLEACAQREMQAERNLQNLRLEAEVEDFTRSIPEKLPEDIS